jgi:hypothetical protein
VVRTTFRDPPLNPTVEGGRWGSREPKQLKHQHDRTTAGHSVEARRLHAGVESRRMLLRRFCLDVRVCRLVKQCKEPLEAGK